MGVSIQDEILGTHPENGLFNSWTECKDTDCTDIKRHRLLLAKDEERENAIESIAKWLITYHVTDAKKHALDRKKVILDKYDFKEYAEMLHVFPRTDITKKGNMGEIVLTEYLSKSTGIKVLIYKFHYNPNIDQSMKGDDVLLVDDKRLLLGESKFRKKPTKQAVIEASENMKDILALPSSLGFFAETLMQKGELVLAEQLLDIQFKISKTGYDIKNIGFIFSDKTVGKIVERNMNSTNKEFAFISFGIENPEEFVELAFKKAEELLLGGNVNEPEFSN